MGNYRTKKTVRAGIVDLAETGNVTVVDYQPGNGTRYLLQVTKHGRQATELLGGCWTVARLDSHYSAAITIAARGFIHWTYIAEKMRVNRADAVVLAEVIGELTGRPATTSEQADDEDRRDGEIEEFPPVANDT